MAADTVDHDVDASEVGHDLRGVGGDLLRAHVVHSVAAKLVPLPGHAGYALFHGSPVGVIAHGHIGPALNEGFGHATTDDAGGTGNNGVLPRKIEFVVFHPAFPCNFGRTDAEMRTFSDHINNSQQLSAARSTPAPQFLVRPSLMRCSMWFVSLWSSYDEDDYPDSTRLT